MQFSRGGQGDQRRRRVLIEENLADPKAAIGDVNAKGRAGRRSSKEGGLGTYTAAALAENQPPITVLIPRRLWTLTVWLLLGLTAIAGLEAAYGQLQLRPRSLLSQTASLNVVSRGGLASWLSSLLLLAAAFQSVLIYRLRRHRVDDYRGRYRLWCWMPVVWVGMAIGISTHVGEDLADLTRLLLPHEGWAFATWWPLAWGGVWLTLAMRLAIEIRRSRGALSFLLVATVCYLGSCLMAAGVWGLPAGMLQTMVDSTALMSGHLAVFIALAVYSRYVFLDAHGLLAAARRPRAAAKPKKTPAAAKPAAATPEPARVAARPKEPEPSVPRSGLAGNEAPVRQPERATTTTAAPPAAPRPTVPPAPAKAPLPRPAVPLRSDATSAASAAADDDEDDDEPISRAERKRLRKLQRREQTRRAA